MSYRDSSFGSFVNPSQRNYEDELKLEVVFHNTALINLLGTIDVKGLNDLLDKPAFVNSQLRDPVSLVAAA